MANIAATLTLKDGTTVTGKSYGAQTAAAGEVVFATGMVGYPEGLTDPSYKGQILILTYPIIGSYGVPEKQLWESNRLQVSGLIVSNYIDTPSHFQSKMTLAHWFKKENVPLLEIKDTRFLTKKIREQGVMLGSIVHKNDISFYDPDKDNLVAQVSTKKVQIFSPQNAHTKHKTVVFIDCGGKNNIIRCFLNRGVTVVHVPWDYNPFEENLQFDALFISNGPGNPKMADKTIATIKKSLENRTPTLGICLGNQLLALAAGGDTYKLKYGHRSQNQPCLLAESNRCYITTQNHGFAVGDVPQGFKPWFINANDNTIEGIRHETLPIMSVQFHPEATPGPTDTEWIFDYFLEKVT
jgi:carbamoyl-phosphate synthase small subunit